jgi:hypothetical protein
MRHFLRTLVAGVGLALMATSAMVFPAAALTVPPTFAPRLFPNQQTHYLRFSVNFNSCPLPASAGSCNFKVGALPYNAFIVRGYIQVTTAFNSTTTDTLNLGTASGGAQLVSAQSTHAAIASTALTLVSAGLTPTGNNTVSTGADGGFDVWANIAYTGASAATAGAATVILEYFAPNDGSCIQTVPFGGSSGPC